MGRTSQSGAVRRTGYNTKRLKLSTYRNKLWETTRFKTHWRSRLSTQVTIPVTASAADMTVGLSSSWGGNEALGGTDTNFWQVTGGAQELPDEQSFPVTADLTIRGGRWGRRWYNAGTSTVRLERWEIYYKREIPTGTTAALFNVGVGWDPTYIVDFQNQFKVGRKIVTSIEPGDTFTIENKVPIAKVDQSLWESGSQRAFTYTSYNTADNTAGSVIVTSWHSVSFVGDVSELGV